MTFASENELVLVDKPAGITSFGAVARLRRQLRDQFGKKVKVGHTGTLDPFATGLLLLVTGTRCRDAGSFSKLDKVYEATVYLGTTSTTGDPEGELTAQSDRQPSLEEITPVVASFVGTITQRPPAFSAIKINGQRAYALARKGIEVEVPERTVTIHSIEILSYEYPNLRIRAHVGSGTYIRTLAEDIGSALGVGAYCSQLRRTQVGDYHVDDAITLAG